MLTLPAIVRRSIKKRVSRFNVAERWLKRSEPGTHRRASPDGWKKGQYIVDETTITCWTPKQDTTHEQCTIAHKYSARSFTQSLRFPGGIALHRRYNQQRPTRICCCRNRSGHRMEKASSLPTNVAVFAKNQASHRFIGVHLR